MKARIVLPALGLVAALTALSACVAPVGPVEVTRFHVPDAPLGRGPIAVVAAPGRADTSLELRTYQAAVARELVRAGYVEDAAGGAQVAEVRMTRRTWQPDRERGPVSVGVGAGGGSYGGGVGMGVGIDLSGPPAAQTETELGVVIKDRASGRTVWEGRALFVVRADSPLAQSDLGAAKLAEALFRGFPGNSGETILVK
ncbi:MAG: DUF4136 domain-containing protein [Novosphingobium sp.]